MSKCLDAIGILTHFVASYLRAKFNSSLLKHRKKTISANLYELEGYRSQ